MAQQVYATIHFIDGSSLSFSFHRDTASSAAEVAANVKKGLEQETFSIEVDDSLMVIPRTSVKYLQITPSPASLPKETIKKARIIE